MRCGLSCTQKRKAMNKGCGGGGGGYHKLHGDTGGEKVSDPFGLQATTGGFH